MSLILDHVNGVADDHRMSNLRIVCPNCAATFDTHCARNKRRRLNERTCLHCKDLFLPRTRSQRYCSSACGRRQVINRARGAQPAKRKVARPPFEQLIAEIAATSFLAVGRRYGVSDNAVRKWLRAYESEAS